MKFSVCLDALFRQIPEDAAMEQVKAAGIDAVEFWSWNNKDLDRIDEARKRLDMTIAAFCTTCFELTDAAGHDAFLSGLKETMAVAKRLDCRTLITQVGPEHAGMSREVQHENIVAGLRRCVPLLEENGITLTFEPLNTRVDHKGYYLYSSEEAFEIAKEVNSPFVKVLFDYYHQQITEGDLIRRSRDMLGSIGHIHCAGNPGRHEPDLGEIRYGAIFDMLDEQGYEGFAGLEYFPTRPPEETLRQLAARYGGSRI